MAIDTMWKLRGLIQAAYSKIRANRLKNDASKWPVNDLNADGERDWLRCSHDFLERKLQEEVLELCSAIRTFEPILNIRKEAGDVAAMAMMIADKAGALEGSARGPKVVVLCGSTKFKDQFMQAQFEETMKSNIVLSVGAFMHKDKVIYRDGEKLMLDDLHKRKIDLGDEILVINVGGYIGESTRSEIDYAIYTGKLVRYLEPLETPTPVLAHTSTTALWPFPH